MGILDRLFRKDKVSGAGPRDEKAWMEAYVMFEIAWELATGKTAQGLTMINFTRALRQMAPAEILSLARRLTAAANSGEGTQEAKSIEAHLMLQHLR